MADPSPARAGPTQPHYMNALNEAQRRAVVHHGSPLLILAGAGSGKTRVIITKIAHLIDARGLDPRSIVAVTFTNKAANEMRERVLGMTSQAGKVMIRTFHSFGAWMLRVNAEAAGIDPHFLIYDEDDSASLLKDVMGGKEDRGFLRRTFEDISRAKDLGIGGNSPAEDIERVGCSPEIFRQYEARLRATGNVDFGDLILLPIRLLRENPELRERTRQRFQAILVDEYQDSNIAQFELLRELVRPESYLCVVGDDDQSIYRFRGAEVGNILSFPKAFPGTEIIRLEQNYRSTQAILDVASAVVSHNSSRLGKTLWTENPPGDPVTLVRLAGEVEEARFCGEIVADGKEGETAILYRMNSQSRAFEDYFLHQGIPYRVVGTVRFYSREEVKDAIGYLSLLANPRDEVSFRRIVNKPARGIGSSSVEKILADWRSEGGSLWDASGRASKRLGSKARAALVELASSFQSFRSAMEELTLSELVDRILSRTGLYDLYKSRDTADGTVKAANLEELVNATSDYQRGLAGLSQFLENLSLASAVDEAVARGSSAFSASDARTPVTLITLHNTKGLEFDRVIITGLEDGIFPHESSSGAVEDIEEERRLFYVGITRARRSLYLTHCRRRRIFGRYSDREPSRFLSEIPREALRVVGEEPGEEDGFPLGAGVFHDEYGPGVVEKKWYTQGNLLVEVRFQSGRVARFLPRYTRLERISLGEGQ